MSIRSGKTAQLIEGLFVSVVLGSVLLCKLEKVPFFPDESQWIATSFYFEALFSRDPSLSEWSKLGQSFMGRPYTAWAENYWTLTQPPIARYIIAMGGLGGGYRVGDLNAPWQFDLDEDENIVFGTMPSPGLLWWSRLPMTLLAVASGLFLFLFVRDSAGRAPPARSVDVGGGAGTPSRAARQHPESLQAQIAELHV